METFKVRLTRISIEEAYVEVEADTSREARDIAFKRDQEGMGDYDGKFDVVASATTVDMGTAETDGMQRMRKIEQILATAKYGPYAVRKLLADIRQYCAVVGIHYETEEREAYAQWLKKTGFCD